MSALELQVYDLFKKRFNDEEARLVIEFFDAKADKKYEQNLKVVSTKEDLVREIGSVRKEISEAKFEMIKWMFIFWVGQMAATAALIKFIR